MCVQGECRPIGGSGGTGGSNGDGGAPPSPYEVVPDGDTLKSFVYTWTGGFLPEPDAESTCDPSHYQNRITITSDGTMTWDYCSWTFAPQSLLVCHAEIAQAERTLAEEDLSRVLAGLSEVHIGSTGGCGVDYPVETLDVVTNQTVLLYEADTYAGCPGPDRGRTYVLDLAPLWTVLNSLLPAS